MSVNSLEVSPFEKPDLSTCKHIHMCRYADSQEGPPTFFVGEVLFAASRNFALTSPLGAKHASRPVASLQNPTVLFCTKSCRRKGWMAFS